MALRIRLARSGTRNAPFYNVVVADHAAKRDGKFIERLGHYNPRLANRQDRLKVDLERAKHWLSMGAQASDRMHRLLAEVGALSAPSIPSQTKKNQPKAKTQERLKAQQEAAAKAAEAAAAPAAEAAADAPAA